MPTEVWYTNKDIYEMVMGLKDDLHETRTLIKEYNGLREKLNQCTIEIAEIKSVAAGRSGVATGIRVWGGWIVGILSLILAIIKTIGG